MRYSSARPLSDSRERLAVERHQVEPARSDLVRSGAGERARLRAGRTERGLDAGGVVHLHQELPPAALHQLRLRRAERDEGRGAGMDRHAEQTVAIEHPLDHLCRVGARRGAEGALVVGRERRPEILGGGNDALNLGEQGLDFDVSHERKVRPRGDRSRGTRGGGRRSGGAPCA